MKTTETIKETCLLNLHQSLGAKCIPFAGYNLPVWYSNLKDEHLAVREKSGIFDVSHMGLLELKGNEAKDLLQKLFTNDINKTLPDKMVYGFFLNEQGMILDDVMCGCLNDTFLVIVNASNKAKIIAWINANKPSSVSVNDLNDEYAFMAVQGPEAIKQLESTFRIDLSLLKRFRIQEQTIFSEKCNILRTGYTGEDGVEIMAPVAIAEKIFKTCVDAGITPCGLAARDTLRLEKALPLYGQELSESIHPFMTRYTWAVKLDTNFIGKESLLDVKDNPEFVTVGLELPEKMIPRPHNKIEEGGQITSGTLSPSLNKPIALAFVKPEYAELGSVVHVEVRKKSVEAKVIDLPFVNN